MSYDKYDRHIAEGNARRILKERATVNYNVKGQLPIFYRYVVIDVIFDPQFVDNDKIDYWKTLGVSNVKYAYHPPRNTIIGQRISDAISNASDPPMFLLPFFPSHLAMPCKAGEHVWVMFEGPGVFEMDIGYWFCKIADVGYVDDVNHAHAPRSFEPTFTEPGAKQKYDGKTDAVYEFRNGKAGEIEGERYTITETAVVRGTNGTSSDTYEKLMTLTDASKVTTYEPVPRYRKRPADLVLEGSNNTLISLGTDRVGPAALRQFDADNNNNIGFIPEIPDTDIVGKSGAIDIVAGRGQTPATGGDVAVSKKTSTGEDFRQELEKMPSKLKPSEGDPDYVNDRSRILVAQKTNADVNFAISDYNDKYFSGGDDSLNGNPANPGNGAVVIKSDKIRIIARMDVEILVSGYDPNQLPNIVDSKNQANYASIVIRSNGDIVFRPSDQGFIKIGGDDASLAVLCQTNAVADAGNVSAGPIQDTFGGSHGMGGVYGTYAKKVLLK